MGLGESRQPTDMFHVTSVHRASRDDEKTYHTAFNQMMVQGTIGNKKYTLEQLDTWGSYHFEVGQDYTVDGVKGESVKLEVPGKKKPRAESLNIITVEELAAASAATLNSEQGLHPVGWSLPLCKLSLYHLGN
jgi:hypothetical protein